MSSGITELSPLDQIRLVEADIARQLLASREAAEGKVAKVRIHAEQIVYAARDPGRKEGEGHYKDIILNAEEEARTIIAQAHHRVAELKQRGKQRMPALTLIVVDTVTGLKGETPADER